MENLYFESNLTMVEDIEFEDKVQINIKQEPNVKQEPLKQEKRPAVFGSDVGSEKKMEENIQTLYEELDKDLVDFGQIRSLKIRQFVEKIEHYDSVNRQLSIEIVSLKAKIVEITDEYETVMSLNAKNMNSIVKMHEKALENKNNELTNMKQKLQSSNLINQKLSQELEDLWMNKNVFPIQTSEPVQDAINEPREDGEIESCEKGNQAKFSGKKNLLKMEDKAQKRKQREAVPSRIQPYKLKKVHEVKKQYHCPKCDRCFSKKDTLYYHTKVFHEGKNPFICHNCGVKFIEKARLEKHIQIVHETNKSFDLKCSLCEYTCRRRNYGRNRLENHIKEAHKENSKPFACSLCNSKFGLKSILNRHWCAGKLPAIDHGKEDRQNCSLCSRTFSHISRLNAHMTSFHEGKKSK